MKNFKRILAMLLVLVMVAAVMTACGKKEEAEPAAEATPAAEPAESGEEYPDSLQFGYIYTGTGYFWDPITKGAMDRAEEIEAEYGTKIVVTAQSPTTSGDISQQIQVFEDMISQGYDGIEIACIDSDAMTSSIDKAFDQGACVVTCDTDAPNSNRVAFVGSNNYQFGYLQGEKAAELTGEGGSIIVVNGVATQLGMIQRVEGITDALEEGKCELTDIQSGGAGLDMTAMIETLISANPNFDCLIIDNAGGENIVNYWVAHNWTAADHLCVLADDLVPVVDGVKNEIANCTVIQGQYNWGYVGCKVMFDYIIGIEPEEDVIDTGATVITLDNVWDHYDADYTYEKLTGN